MPRPWKHPTTGTYYLKQRVPADLVTKVRGSTIFLPVGGTRHAVKIGDQVKVSLRTKEVEPAKLLFREADDALSLHWQKLRSAPVELTHRQTLEIAGEVYRLTTDSFDENPGRPEWWRAGIRACVAAGSGPTPPDEADETPPALARRVMEALINRSMNDVLDQRVLRISAASRERLRLATIVALANAFQDTLRKAEGDYGPSLVANRYPEPRPAAPPQRIAKDGQTISGLFESWRVEREREGGAASSARRWRPIIASLVAFLGHDEPERVQSDDIRRWREHLLAKGSTSPVTFRKVHLPAVRAIFANGIDSGLVGGNPASGIKLRAPKVVQARSKGFTTEEATAILRAANGAMEAPGRTGDVLRRAQRWVPWLCAYTGARVGEITQLRKEDVATVEGISCLRITPEAGAVKTGMYRNVPIHAHLIELGFLDFVAKQPSGPLFYARGTTSASPWATTAGRLAGWVRETAQVTDPHVKPNHGWRHLFKTVGRGVGIDRFYLDGICGHACQTALERDPGSARKKDPSLGRRAASDREVRGGS